MDNELHLKVLCGYVYIITDVMLSFVSVTSLECYACYNQPGNKDKCIKTTKQCLEHEDICQSTISWQCEYGLCMKHLSVYYILAMWVWPLYETSVSLLYPGNVSMVSVGDICQFIIPWECEYGLCMRHLPVYYILAMWVWPLRETYISLLYPGNVSMASEGDIYQSTISWQCEYGICMRHLSVYYTLVMWVWPLYETSVSLLYPGNVSMASVWNICQSTISWQCEYGLWETSVSLRYPGNVSMAAVWDICQSIIPW